MGSRYTVHTVVRMTTDGVRPTSVAVEASKGSPPITGTVLRAVKVGELATDAIRLGLTREGGRATVLSKERAQLLRAQGPLSDTLEWVAYLHNRATAVGLSAARQVELELGVPRTTASKWVKRAREAGLI
jgi:hypothetical protein